MFITLFALFHLIPNICLIKDKDIYFYISQYYIIRSTAAITIMFYDTLTTTVNLYSTVTTQQVKIY